MIAWIKCTPLDKGASISEYVADAVQVLQESGLRHQVTAMGTIVEGDPDDLWPVLRHAHEAIASRCARVSTIIEIDDRKAWPGSFEDKVESLQTALKRPR